MNIDNLLESIMYILMKWQMVFEPSAIEFNVLIFYKPIIVYKQSILINGIDIYTGIEIGNIYF